MGAPDFLWPHLRALPYFRALLRSVEARLFRGVDLPAPGLDLGCGDGHFTSSAFPAPADVGVDPDRRALREASRRGSHRSLVCAVGSSLPLAAGSMASGFSNSVLEHIADVPIVLAEVGRVLQSGAPWAFTVPNPAYLSELSLGRGRLARTMPGWAEAYRGWFRRMSRVVHLADETMWGEWLKAAGFELVQTFRYFSPTALRVLEWGHYLGLPSLLARRATGRWILAPARWSLWLTETLLRRYDDASARPDGTFTFYLARKRRSL
ncbi:MAG: class I SAM-dependent methyltransferase [Anaerolineales bacterium]